MVKKPPTRYEHMTIYYHIFIYGNVFVEATHILYLCRLQLDLVPLGSLRILPVQGTGGAEMML